MTDNEDKTTSKDSSDTQEPSRRKFLKNTGISTGGVVSDPLLWVTFDYTDQDLKLNRYGQKICKEVMEEME